MQPEDRESLLWTLSEVGDRAPREASEISDEVLVAYREGKLGEDEARRVERTMVRNPTCRRRLEKLAGLEPRAAPVALRRRVLDRLAPSTSRARKEPGARFRWAVSVAAAASVLLAAGWWALWRPTLPPDLPPDLPPEHDVRISALFEQRGQDAPETVEAYADTTVTITATVAGQAEPGVEVGLYRVAGGHLVRLGAGDGVEQRPGQGVVVFEAQAGALLRPDAGDHEVFVVVAWQGELPARLALGPGRDPVAVLATGGRRHVHRLTLRLLAERSAMPSPDGDRPTDEEVGHDSDSLGHHFGHDRLCSEDRRMRVVLGALSG